MGDGRNGGNEGDKRDEGDEGGGGNERILMKDPLTLRETLLISRETF